MNAIVSKFLLAGDKFMPELHLKQPGFTYSACALFSRNKERIEKFMEKGNTGFIYRNEPDKVFFNMIWLMVNQNLAKELYQTKF